MDFFISLLNRVASWAERTLAEVESWEDLSVDGKYERALEKIRQLPVPRVGGEVTGSTSNSTSNEGDDGQL